MQVRDRSAPASTISSVPRELMVKQKGDGPATLVGYNELKTIDRVLDFLLNMPFNPSAPRQSTGRTDEYITILDKLRSWQVRACWLRE